LDYAAANHDGKDQNNLQHGRSLPKDARRKWAVTEIKIITTATTRMRMSRLSTIIVSHHAIAFFMPESRTKKKAALVRNRIEVSAERGALIQFPREQAVDTVA